MNSHFNERERYRYHDKLFMDDLLTSYDLPTVQCQVGIDNKVLKPSFHTDFNDNIVYVLRMIKTHC